ncbi:unnamed protein product [Hermetia illucens]|uniref:Major facilitator superfamily (MFS) profile domain-containing protein n=1 Tax=Hermetia illucens TaxID=343691 RepID=A0A7R8YNB3_HERIL|nr:unnamed protein product [Hermetia illucens]
MDNDKSELSARPIAKSELTWSQILVTVTIAIGAISLGVILSYSAPAIESMKDRNQTNFDVSEAEVSWVVSVVPLTGIIGSFTGGQLLEYAGRKWTMFAMSIPCMAGWLLIGIAANMAMILLGRCLTGISLGMASVSFQVYLSEAVHPSVRGSLGVFGTLAANFGVIVGYGLGTFLNWYQLAFCGLGLIIPFALLTLFALPETPRWYVKKNRESDARRSLTWLRAKGYNVEAEIKEFIRSNSEDNAVKTNQFEQLVKKQNLKPMLIVIGAIFSAQISGVQCLIFYNVSVFKMAGTILKPNVSSMITACGLMLATFVPVCLSDRIGRKALLIFSGVTIFVPMLILGTFIYFMHNKEISPNLSWIPLACMFIILVAYACGYGPIPFLLMGELLPMPIRGLGASLAILGNFLAAFITAKTFLNLLGVLNIYGVFWMYSCFTFLTLFFMAYFVPETKNKTLEEIQRGLVGTGYRKSESSDQS